MKKLKLYLDTSVISYLDQTDSPEKMAETRLFWEKIKAGEFDVVISETVTREIEKCSERKKQVLKTFLGEISYAMIQMDAQVTKLAERFIALHILKPSSLDDCRHIAAAIVAECDAIVSWNFKHIVNHKTQVGVRAITALEGYKDLFIYTPAFFIGGDEDDTL